MPKFYCDYCDTYLTHDSPSVRKTHCSGRKHKENVKDYYQKWMEEQAQSLIDKTTAAFQQGKIPPTPFPGGPPPRWSSSARYATNAPHGRTSYDAHDGAPTTWDDARWTWRHEAADGRTHADDARTTPHDASPPTDDDARPAGHDATGQIRPHGCSPLFAAMNRLCLVRTLGLTLFSIPPLKSSNVHTEVPDEIMSFFLNTYRFFLCRNRGIYSFSLH
ncbi:U1 small nuclear ribonucleoprotein C isoform X1 [Trematomus bernacchii]|uniref:U1 small nuclear ribonucleoprotein C isoform X1 n=1 Tax=Trematomus bernacchii TaxID=40690 RepID=UPI00146BF29A|nr:U1 small nuclear ribonucleoprotein C isoform X1 [Trematomus bernacchii]